MGVEVLEDLPTPRVDVEMEGSRSCRLGASPFSTVSSRLRDLSVLLLPTGAAARMSASPWPMFSMGCSPFAFTASFVGVLVSPALLPVKSPTLSTSAVLPYKLLPLAPLFDAEEDGRCRASWRTDWLEFCRTRTGCDLCVRAGAGLLALAAANVPTTGDEAN